MGLPDFKPTQKAGNTNPVFTARQTALCEVIASSMDAVKSPWPALIHAIAGEAGGQAASARSSTAHQNAYVKIIKARSSGSPAPGSLVTELAIASRAGARAQKTSMCAGSDTDDISIPKS